MGIYNFGEHIVLLKELTKTSDRGSTFVRYALIDPDGCIICSGDDLDPAPMYNPRDGILSAITLLDFVCADTEWEEDDAILQWREQYSDDISTYILPEDEVDEEFIMACRREEHQLGKALAVVTYPDTGEVAYLHRIRDDAPACVWLPEYTVHANAKEAIEAIVGRIGLSPKRLKFYFSGEPLYIALEGIDGCGKDTHAELLKKHYETDGKECVIVHEPNNSTPIGGLIRRMLAFGEGKESLLYLFLADRLHTLVHEILPALAEGKTVISVRSFLSTLVYQQDVWNLSELVELHKVLPAFPDVAVWLDISPETAHQRVMDRLKRDGSAPECFEKLEGLRRYRNRYADLFEGDDLDVLDLHMARFIESVEQCIEATQEGIRNYIKSVHDGY